MNPKLNRLVAERVMGWTLADRVKCGWGEGPDVYVTGIEARPTYQGFDPSESIAAAWSVVESVRLKLFQGYCSITVTRTAAGNPTARYDCQIAERIYDDDGWATDKYKILGMAASAPLAICLAALRAVGVSEQEIQEAMT